MTLRRRLMPSGLAAAAAAGMPAAGGSSLWDQQRNIRILQTAASGRPLHYSTTQKLKGGVDTSTKMTEFFDGGTDDFGTFKEGAPSAVRLEYLRQPEHLNEDTIRHRYLWSPFEAAPDARMYSPLYHDYLHHSSRDEFGHRSGSMPGGPNIGHYCKGRVTPHDTRTLMNYYPQQRVPKWLAVIVNNWKQRRMVGFFLYANGAYVAELLTYKQLPRLVYNKPFQGCIPTIGMSVSLNEVTYGKEVHTLQYYPGHWGVGARRDGDAAVVLRGTEPNLVPMLLPHKEIRLFEATCNAVFGRRAGVLRKNQNMAGYKARNCLRYKPHRPRLGMRNRIVKFHAASGGNGQKANLQHQFDWKMHPFQNVVRRHWLCAYTLKSGSYTRQSSMAELRTKTYSWSTRDPVYRLRHKTTKWDDNGPQ